MTSTMTRTKQRSSEPTLRINISQRPDPALQTSIVQLTDPVNLLQNDVICCEDIGFDDDRGDGGHR